MKQECGMNANDYSDLALGYIQGRLSPQEKQQVFQLIMANPEFRELMRVELQLTSAFARLKATPPQSVKHRVYLRVLEAKREEISPDLARAILTPILNYSLPKCVSRIMTYCQRSV